MGDDRDHRTGGGCRPTDGWARGCCLLKTAGDRHGGGGSRIAAPPPFLCRLWEIAENLHRAELTVIERAEHIAEWVRLTDDTAGKQADGKPAQLAPVNRGGRASGGLPKSGGINAAVRELGIDRTATPRAASGSRMTCWPIWADRAGLLSEMTHPALLIAQLRLFGLFGFFGTIEIEKQHFSRPRDPVRKFMCSCFVRVVLRTPLKGEVPAPPLVREGLKYV